MKIRCERNILKEAISISSRAITNKSPLSILSHLKLETVGDRLRLTSTDLELGIQLMIDCDVLEPGSIMISGDMLTRIVAQLSSNLVTIETLDYGKASIECGTAFFHLSTLPAEEFPSLPLPPGANSIYLPTDVLEEMIKKVGFSATQGSDDNRSVMGGVLIELKNDAITMVATDGRRLASYHRQLETTLDLKDSLSVIVPVRAMNEIRKLFSEKEETIEIEIFESQIFFNQSGRFLQCRVLEGEFPDFTQVIPTNFKRFCVVSRDILLGSLNRMLLMAQEQKSPNLVKFSFNKEKTQIHSNTPELGWAEEDLELDYQGEPLTIAFNGQFILDSLKVLDAEEIEILLQDESNSAVIRPRNLSDYNYVMMPIRLREPVSV